MSNYSEFNNRNVPTIVLHPNLYKIKWPVSQSPSDERLTSSQLEEIVGLANAIKLNVNSSEIIKLSKINPANFFGSGTRERIKDYIISRKIQLAVINTQLSAIQQRNLELHWRCKVIDRTGLIIEIFGARARTHEGVLQVELASLSFQRSRLVRSWTHLERQRGGGGFLGGPGERQIELDRRQIDIAIEQLQKQLKKVRTTRQLHRSSRKRVPYPIVALVGYTNAGKSTLFNKLSGANVTAQDMLFATLDPTMRKIVLPSGKPIILSDTVGFISDLPTHLIEAFKSTLEEVQSADLVLHVRDISHQDTEKQKKDVLSILADLGIPKQEGRLRVVDVFNKMDLLAPDSQPTTPEMVDQINLKISALTGYGCDELLVKIDDILSEDETIHSFALATTDGAAVAWLHENGNVRFTEIIDEKLFIEVVLSEKNANKFYKNFSVYP